MISTIYFVDPFTLSISDLKRGRDRIGKRIDVSSGKWSDTRHFSLDTSWPHNRFKTKFSDLDSMIIHVMHWQ